MVALPIALTPSFTPHVSSGDTVTVGQVLALKKSSPDESISLTDALGVTAKSVKKYVKVQPGDSVKRGDVLAVKKSLIQELKVLSETEGTITGFERDTGELLIRPLMSDGRERTEKLLSPIAGTVRVCNNEQIVIETEKDVVLGESGVGKSGEGEVITITPTEKTPLLFLLDAGVIGKVLLTEEIDRDSLLKAIGMGVVGVISQTIDPADIAYIQKRNIMTPVLSVTKENQIKIKKWEGKSVYLDGEGMTVLLLHT
jgi:hypothetical protein